MADEEEWPAPVGPKALSVPTILPVSGLSREERLQQQLIGLHEDYETRVEEFQRQLTEKQVVITELQGQLEKSIRTSKSHQVEASEKAAEVERLNKALSALRQHNEATERDFLERERFYKDYIRKLDRHVSNDSFATEGTLSGEEEEGGPGPANPPPSDLLAEFEKKEASMVIDSLTKQVRRLKAELSGSGAGKEELSMKVGQLTDELEQMEAHCMTQQQLRREAQATAAKLQAKLDQLEAKAADVEQASAIIETARAQAEQAVLEQTRLHAELAKAKRQGLAAQRQLDELKATLGDTSARSVIVTSPPVLAEATCQTEGEAPLDTKQLDEARALLRLKAEELGSVRAARAAAEAEVTKKREMIEALKTELEGTHRVIEEMERAMEAIKYDVQEAEARRVKEVAGLREQVARERDESTAKGRQVKELRSTLLAAEAGRDATARKVSELEGRADQAEKKLREAEEEVSVLQTKLRELTGAHEAALEESAWLQEQLAAANAAEKASARKAEEMRKEVQAELADKERTIATLTADLEKAVKESKRLARENRSLLCELQGRGGRDPSLIPLPDHRGMPPSDVLDLVAGGLTSWEQILTKLAKQRLAADPLPADDEEGAEERAFLLALSNKVEHMLRYVEASFSTPSTSVDRERKQQLMTKHRTLTNHHADLKKKTALRK